MAYGHRHSASVCNNDSTRLVNLLFGSVRKPYISCCVYALFAVIALYSTVGYSYQHI